MLDEVENVQYEEEKEEDIKVKDPVKFDQIMSAEECSKSV